MSTDGTRLGDLGLGVSVVQAKKSVSPTRNALALLVTLGLFALGCDDGIDGGMVSLDPSLAAIGYHTEFVFEERPNDFALLQEGGDLPVIVGGQGVPMILVGVEVPPATLQDRFTVRLWLDVGGDQRGSVTWTDMEWTVRTAELDGIYNLFIALNGCESFPAGTPGELRIELTDTESQLALTRSVLLGANDLCPG